MKKLILGVAATLMFAASASADILALPNAGVFPDPPGGTSFMFNFPPNGTGTIEGINSISMALTHTFAADVDITLVAPGGALFDLTTDNGGAGDLAGIYTFVQAPAGGGILGNPNTMAGVFDAEVWQTGPFDKVGWQFNFFDDLGGDVGTWSNIVIDFDKGTVIPEPTSALVLLGVAGLAIFRRRR